MAQITGLVLIELSGLPAFVRLHGPSVGELLGLLALGTHVIVPAWYWVLDFLAFVGE